MATFPVSSPLLSPLNIPQRTAFLRYATSVAEFCSRDIGSFRALLEFRDRAYQLQLDQSRDKYREIADTLRGAAKRRVKEIDVPVAMPQIESAVAYQAGVYLTSYPIFGVVATKQNASVANQFETLMGHHSIQYGWARELIKTFRKGFKYNFAPTFVHWKRQQIQRVVTSTEVNAAGTAALKDYVVGGNCIESLDVYNCFFDFRVSASNYHEEGEAFGWNKFMTRMAFKRFVSSLDFSKTTQMREAFESCYDGSGHADAGSTKNFYVPTINPSLNIDTARRGETNWLNWAQNIESHSGRRINYQDAYLVTFFVCRALPSDFGAKGNKPTIYFGIIVNWKVVIYVEELFSLNDTLPVFIMTPQEDDLSYQTQSMLDVALPFQDMSSALWNISLESKRRLVFDRLIYNPRFINKEDIDPASSVARIALRNPSQFKGDDIAKAIHQIPFREDNASSNLQMSEMISQMADVAVGQNKVDRGQFQKGNKTKTEFVETMGNSSARQQLVSLSIENQYMTPVKETMKGNILLNQSPTKLLNREQREEVEIDPVKFRQAVLEFKLTDGLLPASKMLNSELMTVFIQTAQAMPVMMSEYDVLGMFIYWAKMQGAVWLDDFKRNPEEQQKFLDLYKQTNAAEAALPPEQQLPGAQ